jgi:hypothetical protein
MTSNGETSSARTGSTIATTARGSERDVMNLYKDLPSFGGSGILDFHTFAFRFKMFLKHKDLTYIIERENDNDNAADSAEIKADKAQRNVNQRKLDDIAVRDYLVNKLDSDYLGLLDYDENKTGHEMFKILKSQFENASTASTDTLLDQLLYKSYKPGSFFFFFDRT